MPMQTKAGSISMIIPQCIILEIPDTLSQWWCIWFSLCISGDSSENLHCGNVVNMPYSHFVGWSLGSGATLSPGANLAVCVNEWEVVWTSVDGRQLGELTGYLVIFSLRNLLESLSVRPQNRQLSGKRIVRQFNLQSAQFPTNSVPF